MTPATSVSFYKPVFSDFLYAPVDTGWNGNPLSVLSALSRLDVDPWMEAAELAELPRDGARRRLVELLERLPNRPWARADSGPIADRLLKLLPQISSSDGLTASRGRGMPQVTFTPRLRMIIFLAAIGVYAIAIGVHRGPLSQSDMPAVTAAKVSQSLIPQPSH